MLSFGVIASIFHPTRSGWPAHLTFVGRSLDLMGPRTNSIHHYLVQIGAEDGERWNDCAMKLQLEENVWEKNGVKMVFQLLKLEKAITWKPNLISRITFKVKFSNVFNVMIHNLFTVSKCWFIFLKRYIKSYLIVLYEFFP